LAKDCPTKLYYTGKAEYPDENAEDSFLQSLAEGGFQVGELAKLYFPGGEKNDIEEIGYESSIARTSELLKQDEVVIFEAAIAYENLFIRADILVKKGNRLQLIEVKAKSYEGADDSFFFNASGNNLNSDYRSYLEDVAFQKYVLTHAYPGKQVSSFLMLADKSEITTVSGLNQLFRIVSVNGRKKAIVDREKLESQGLGKKILTKVSADRAVEFIYNELDANGGTFFDQIKLYANAYRDDQKIRTPIGKHCKVCEFKATDAEEKEGKRSGFKECWMEQTHLTDTDFLKPFVFDVWSYRGADAKIQEGTYLIEDLSEEDFPFDPGSPILSPKERQWLQVKKVIEKDPTPYLNRDALRSEMSRWKYPLHFIDFETSAVAIPFFKGMRPYEGIAFQFSHHQVDRDGKIKHASQFLNANPFEFPNFSFIRALKQALEKDEGTIFRYSSHENSYFNHIYPQLQNSEEADKDELLAWMRTITTSRKGTIPEWEGERNMVDLLELVKYYFYHPRMGGSNSIKEVLPAVLNESKYLQTKYAKPMYGNEIPSFNFKNMVWIEWEEDGKTVKNPYKLLPPIFAELLADEQTHQWIKSSGLDRLADGGAAMTAYSILQGLEDKTHVRNSLESALLKYCELDTLAMVLIWEYWEHEIDQNG